MNKQTILIADDDRDLIALLERRCLAMGLAVKTANDAITALRKIDATPPDVVILDVNMPAGNGLSVREMMADNARLSTIPVIILTGNSDESTIRRCHSLCAYYVTKCPDVWSRVQPLLMELLHLDAPYEDGLKAAKTASGHATQRSSVVDTVFAMVGWDEAYLDGTEIHAPQRQQIEGPWVLCIDDDSELSFTLKLRLEQYGVQVLRAFEGMEGYRYACLAPAQAIILDFEMPGGNGDYVLRRLKESRLTCDIPVIVLTGRKDKSLERQMRSQGAAEFLTKPCDWDTLSRVLLRYLEHDSSIEDDLHVPAATL